MSSITLPYLKAKQDLENPCGVVYSFLCPCESSYIGQTSRRCFTRFKEHNRTSLDSHVRTNIEKCQTFQKLLKKETKKRYPSLCDRRKFLLPKFSILHKNINKYSQRIMFENIEIQLRKPSINKQNESTKIRFLS